MTEERRPYFVAVARSARDSMPKNWVDILSAVEGVKLVSATEFRAKIEATPHAVEKIRKRFDKAVLVEETVERKAL